MGTDKIKERHLDDDFNLPVEKGGRVNPNLLHNWYFGNPINRKGQTEYSGSGTTIDRWFKSAQGKMILDSGKIILDNIESTSTTWYQFFLDNNIYDLLYNQTVTGSMLMSNGELKVATGIFRNNGNSTFIAADLDEFGNGLRLYTKANEGYPAFQIQVLAGYSLEIVACKLELGDQQTLAHQDENGNWVLNEIPDYAEQMAICMQYDKSGGAYKGAEFLLLDAGDANALNNWLVINGGFSRYLGNSDRFQLDTLNVAKDYKNRRTFSLYNSSTKSLADCLVIGEQKDGTFLHPGGGWRIYGEHNKELLASTLETLIANGGMSTLQSAIRTETVTLGYNSTFSGTGRGKLFVSLYAGNSASIVIDGVAVGSISNGTNSNYTTSEIEIEFLNSFSVTHTTNGSAKISCNAVYY